AVIEELAAVAGPVRRFEMLDGAANNVALAGVDVEYLESALNYALRVGDDAGGVHRDIREDCRLLVGGVVGTDGKAGVRGGGQIESDGADGLKRTSGLCHFGGDDIAGAFEPQTGRRLNGGLHFLGLAALRLPELQ